MKTSKKIISVVMTLVFVIGCLQMSIVSFAATKSIDLAFVIDTTGSMEDDINQVKTNMKNYLDDIAASGNDFRIAIVDYRDFASRTGSSSDYPYKVHLDFTSDRSSIISAINSLSLGNGGDTKETICSALIDGLSELSWRSTAGKAAILMGDAPALDPEPITNYTKDMAINKLKTDSIGYGEEIRTTAFSSVSAMADPMAARSKVTLFTVATSYNSEAIRDFDYLAEGTGGESYVAGSSSDISDIITEIIDVIPEVVEEPTIFEIIWNWIISIVRWIIGLVFRIFPAIA